MCCLFCLLFPSSLFSTHFFFPISGGFNRFLLPFVSGLQHHSHSISFNCHDKAYVSVNCKAFTQETCHCFRAVQETDQTDCSRPTDLLWSREWCTEVSYRKDLTDAWDRKPSECLMGFEPMASQESIWSCYHWVAEGLMVIYRSCILLACHKQTNKQEQKRQLWNPSLNFHETF